jgi:fatty acid desaturase
VLKHWRDLHSLAYLAGTPALAAWQWRFGWSPVLYAVMLVMWVGVGVIHHHHAHVPMWRWRWLNEATNVWISVLQGHPTFVFHPAHNANHHRHRHGPKDVARTYRFRGGDTNTLLGYLAHPFQAAGVLFPLLWRYLRKLRVRCPAQFLAALTQFTVLAGGWGLLIWLSPTQALIYVLIPQALALHWLLGANYLQHAHADGNSRWNYARNFEGGVNWLYFNIGLHTAHHEQPGMHWSRLPALHAQLREHIDPALIEPSLLRYMGRVFFGSLLHASWRSASLQKPPPSLPETHR